jgi:hypothetical protein
MSVLIAYKNNPDKVSVMELVHQPTHFVLAKDMAEARFICEGDLRCCETNIFEGEQVKNWFDAVFPWDKVINYTAQQIADKYGDRMKAAKAFLSGEMTDEDERIAIFRKFNPMTLIQASHQMVMEKLDNLIQFEKFNH